MMRRVAARAPPASCSRTPAAWEWLPGGAGGAVTGRPQQQRRAILTHKATKDLNTGKMLDIYARRDPQLAPYLLREVDMEFKRKNTKVRFVVWSCLFVLLFMMNERINCENVHQLRRYVELLQYEEDEKDIDADLRRAKLMAVLALVRQAWARDQTWRQSDTDAAVHAVRTVAAVDPDADSVGVPPPTLA